MQFQHSCWNIPRVVSLVPPEKKYFTEAKFRQNKITKRSGVKEVYFGKISL